MSRDGVTLAIIREDAPIAFVVGNSKDALIATEMLAYQNVTVINAPSWEDAAFSLSPSTFKRLFADLESSDGRDGLSINLQKFSAKDIWSATL